MEEFKGKKIKLKTEKSVIEGILYEFSVDSGNFVIENQGNKMNLKISDVLDVSLIKEDEKIASPLKEADMYSLFYEAFNVFGPYEDQLIYTVAVSLKKFLKDLKTSSVKIVIESDDIFGRIGFCFARLLLDKVEYLSVETRCEFFDLSTLRYKNTFLNSGGILDDSSDSTTFSLLLFACNRNCSFNKDNIPSSQIIVLDIPKTLSFSNFNGIGLGFIPENYKVCNKCYFVVDVGFGSYLCSKYRIPSNYKNSLVKYDVPQKQGA